MSSRVVGHESQKRRLADAWLADRLAHAYLFVGPSGVGKRTFAVQLAQAVLCQRPNRQAIEPCGVCGSCKAFEGGGHPDYFTAEMEKDRHEFRIEVIRNLLPKLALKPALGARRVAVLDDADRFNDEAGNAFLKTLEEPPMGSLLILIATGVEGLLPTIRSRCQTVAFTPLSIEETEEVLQRTGMAASPEEARFLAKESGGSVEGVDELRDEEWRALKPRIGERLLTPGVDAVVFAKELNKWIEGAGKESAAKRRRATLIIATALDAFQTALKSSDGSVDHETLCNMIHRTLTADEQVKRYLHLATVVDCWVDDLAQIAAGSFSVV